MLLVDRVSRKRIAGTNLAKTNTFIIVVAIFVALSSQLLMFALRIPPEAALNFQCGLLIADGQVPFVDFFDVASPGIMYLCAIPAALSKLAPAIHPILFFHFFVLALAACSCILTALILFRQRMREQAHVPFFVIGFALLNLLTIIEFGQREHLFLLFYIPFFFTRWLTWTNQPSERRLSQIAGVSGGVAVCLDPLFLLVFLFMEVFFLVSKLKWSPFLAIEMKALLGVLLTFCCHFAFFPREYGNLYFNYALPMVLCDYKIWDDRLWWVGKTPDRRDLVYFMVIACVVALGLRRWCSLIAPCVALAIVGFGLFVIEGKSLTFQMLPMVYGASFCVFLILSILVHFAIKSRGFKLDFLKPTMVSVLCVLSVGAFIFQSTRTGAAIKDLTKLGYWGNTYWTEESPFAATLERDSNVQDKVLILNDRVRPAYPLIVQFNRRPATYLLTGFPVGMSRLLMEHEPENAKTYSGFQFEMYERLIHDIKTVKPRLIMIEKESIGENLKTYKVMEAIDSLYEESGFAEWPDSDSEPMFDYYAFRTALVLYKLKAEVK